MLLEVSGVSFHLAFVASVLHRSRLREHSSLEPICAFHLKVASCGFQSELACESNFASLLVSRGVLWLVLGERGCKCMEGAVLAGVSRQALL